MQSGTKNTTRKPFFSDYILSHTQICKKSVGKNVQIKQQIETWNQKGEKNSKLW